MRGGTVDQCEKCGVLRWFSGVIEGDGEGGYDVMTFYITQEQATRFVTTNKPIKLSNYIPCNEE